MAGYAQKILLRVFLILGSVLFLIASDVSAQSLKSWSASNAHVRIVIDLMGDSTSPFVFQENEIYRLVESSAKTSGFNITESSDNVIAIAVTQGFKRANDTTKLVQVKVAFLPDANKDILALEASAPFARTDLVREQHFKQQTTNISVILSSVQSLAQTLLVKVKGQMKMVRKNERSLYLDSWGRERQNADEPNYNTKDD